MKKTNHPDRQGMILIAALVLMFVLSSFVTAAAVAVRVSYEFDDQSARTSTLRRALDAAIARSRTRLTQTGPTPLNFQGTLQDATYHVQGRATSEATYHIRVSSRTKEGGTRQCRVILRVIGQENGHSTRVLSYEEPDSSAHTMTTADKQPESE
jgi:hypothetical protein